MSPAIRVLLLASLGVLASPLQRAAAGERVLYDLRHGSYYSAVCLLCGRCCDPRFALHGTFVLDRVSETEYRVGSLDLLSDFGTAITGSGTYSLSEESGPAHEMALTLSVDGHQGVEVESGAVARPSPWPLIDVFLSEPESDGAVSIHTLRIVAAPRVELVPYVLEEGSSLVYGRGLAPPVSIPIEGTFLLGQIARDLDLGDLYRVDDIDFRSARPEDHGDWSVTGAGLYARRGDRHQADLDIEIKESHPNPRIVVRVSGTEEAKQPFPVLHIDLRRPQVDDNHFVVLQIKARPRDTGAADFIRGDSNDDGAVNIADAQYLLNFLFLGGPKPACEEATNVNDDGRSNIADAQYLLNFLFLGGPKPNAPYPDCGADPGGEALGCESSACE